MTIAWPEALRRLREMRAHWRRRLNRIEYVALDGARVDQEVFPTFRAYHAGKADAYDEAIEIIEACRIKGVIPPLDVAVIVLAQEGFGPEAIANRCGVELSDVAESLARFASASYIEEDDEKG